MRWFFYFCAFCLVWGVWALGHVWAGQADLAESEMQVLCAEGEQLLRQNLGDEAEKRFRAVMEINRKYAPAYVGLGHVFLNRDSLTLAEDAFKKARNLNPDYAPAYNGLGLVFLQRTRELQWAITYFRQACKKDPTYSEAFYNLAKVYRDIGDTKELDTYEDLVDFVPDHPDAWFQLGRIYEEGRLYRFANLKMSEAAYRRQVAVNGDHFLAHIRLSGLLKNRGATDEAIPLLKRALSKSNEFQREALLELAEVYQKRREFDEAERLFNAYIDSLESKEQALYYDLRLVTYGDKRRAFDVAPKTSWKEASDAFWVSRDPAPVTAANERRLEHYRRVAYAREHFSEFQFPWDMRGEVYIRFGEPDHISRSGNIRFETAPKVVRVKERLMLQAGDAITSLKIARDGLIDELDLQINQTKNDFGEPVAALGGMNAILSEVEGTGGFRTVDASQEAKGLAGNPKGDNLKLDMLLKTGSILGWPVYPVREKIWEYWIYADIGRGIEVTFTQRYPSGPYGYADLPHSIGLRTGGTADHFTIWQRLNPAIVIDQVVAFQPDYYWPDFATGPLEFFFDAASFKGDSEHTKLEVYYGVPVRELTFVKNERGGQSARVKRGVTLYDDNNQQIYRFDDEMVYDGPVDSTLMAFLPEWDQVTVVPGTYRMAVQILDVASQKSQVYNKLVVLPTYEDQHVRLSDIQLSSSIRNDKRDRFVKGDIQVLPNPTRTYLLGQPISVYYEVYNLKRNSFGQTHYRVAYEVRSADKRSVVGTVLGGFGKLLGQKQESGAITVEYDHTGTRVDEPGYLEVDLSRSEPGEYVLKVYVTDEFTKKQTTGYAVFDVR
jgi:GWxTD domain-containing protein